MIINVAVPTRGKPAYVADYPYETARNARLKTTRVVIGFDDDDNSTPVVQPHRNMQISVAQREDSLGAKFNRCARQYPADMYVLSMDDVAIATPGWDEIIAERAALFKDGIGYVYFGREINGERLPSMMAVTRRVVDLIGFCPEYFPFWFNNVWIDEVANLIGGYGRRVLPAEIDVRYPRGTLPEPPRRDVRFWGQFVDTSRPLRLAQAETLIEAMDDGPTAKAILRATMAAKCVEFARWNAPLCDPGIAARMVRVTEPLDGRHARLQAKASAVVASLTERAA